MFVFVTRYIYDMLDISQFDVERELGAYPYAIFRVESLQPQDAKNPGVFYSFSAVHLNYVFTRPVSIFSKFIKMVPFMCDSSYLRFHKPET